MTGTSASREAGNRTCFRWKGCSHYLRPGFRKLGEIVGKKPVSTIFVVLCVTCICSIGLVRLDTSLSHRVWFDDQSASYTQLYGTIESIWPTNFCVNEVILKAEPGPNINQGILAPACLAEVRALRDNITKHIPKDACGLREEECEDSFFRLLDDEGVPASRASEYLAQQFQDNGFPVQISAVVSGMCCGPNFSQASALKLRFPSLIKESSETAAFDSWFIEHIQNWRPSEASKALCPSLEHARYIACNSFSWEQQAALLKDITLLCIAVIVMLVYLAIALGRAANCVESKILLAFSVVLAVSFSLVIAFGVGTLLGIGFSHMSLLSLFLLLGVGIDDSFIINDAFERADKSLEPGMRLAEALFEVGPSVMLTSATDLLAFVVGATYKVAAIRWFCLTAAIAVFIVFLCQISFFSACVVLNKRREKAGRCDICPCVTLRPPQEVSVEEAASRGMEASIDVESNETSEETSASGGVTVSVDVENKKEQISKGKVSLFECGKRPRALHIADMFHMCIVMPVVLCFVALLVLSLYFLSTKVTKGVEISDFISYDSYLVDFWETDGAHFGFLNPVGVFTTPVDVGSQEQIQLLQKTVHAIASGSSEARPITWVDAYVSWYLSNGTTANNSQLLQRFLESPNSSPFRSDLIPAGGNLVTARAWVWVALASDSEGNLQLTRQIRSTYDEVLQGRIPGFVWSEFFLSSDRFDGIDDTVIQSQIIGLCIVAGVCFLMMPLAAAGSSMLCIVLVNINIIGWASLWGVPISTNLAAILVLALGFSVDYSSHIAESLSSRSISNGRTTPEDPLKVVTETLREVGASVLHGGLSTFLAVLMLAFSKSKGFQDLFKCLFLMVLFGLLHGLVLLPMLFLGFSKLRNKYRSSPIVNNH